MADHPVLVTLPDDVYGQAEAIAKAAEQPIEAILRQRLEESFADRRSQLPPDEQAELGALKYLSDAALWTIAQEQMPMPRQKQMQQLMDRNSDGSITPIEYETLTQLVEQGQRLILRKATAAGLLMDRGYLVSADDMQPPDG